MAKSKAGGGINSRVNVAPRVRTGERGRAINPGGVGQIGQSQGDHVTNKNKTLRGSVEPVRGDLRPAGSPGSVPLGNAVALNVGRGGPGAGRKLYGQSGMQGQHGTASPGNPPSKSTDILRQFGPDYKAPGR
jgi:hypothetical protein